MRDVPTDLEPFLEQLKTLPFIDEAVVAAGEQAPRAYAADLRVTLETPTGRHDLIVRRKGQLTSHLADILVRDAPLGDPLWMVFADRVTPAMGALLAERGINFVDLAGNCRLRIQDHYFAVVEGRKPKRIPGRKPRVRPALYAVQFALLANKALANADVRTLAAEAGVGRTAAAEALQILKAEGAIGKTTAGYKLVRRTEVLERWLVGYADVLRPRQIIGTFQTPDRTPAELEERLEERLGAARVDWALGGAAAAFRLDGHHRGERTVVHISDRLTAAQLAALQARPAANGPLVLHQALGAATFRGAVEHTAHPLLVYAELMATGGERMREAAELLRKRHLDAVVEP